MVVQAYSLASYSKVMWFNQAENSENFLPAALETEFNHFEIILFESTQTLTKEGRGGINQSADQSYKENLYIFGLTEAHI